MGRYQQNAFVEAFDVNELAATTCVRRFITDAETCLHSPLDADTDPDRLRKGLHLVELQNEPVTICEISTELRVSYRLSVESDTGHTHRKITDDGLEEHDQRILSPLMMGSNPHELDGRELSIWLLDERRRWYQIVDDRNHSVDSYPLVDRPAYSAADLEENPYYERLETSWEVVQQLKRAVQDDPQFDDESEDRIVKRLMNMESHLFGVQLDVDCPKPRSKRDANPTLYHNPDWETYDEALSMIETRLTAVSDAHRNAITDTRQLTDVRLGVHRLESAIEDLREYIATPTVKPTDTP